MIHQTYQHRPRRTGSYFLPFLSLIILGLIVVLLFQLVGYFRDKSVKALENKAAVQIAAGRAEMKIWGMEQWTPAVSEGILHEGDMIKTAPGSRVVLALLNGSVVRLNSETEVELTSLKSRDGHDELALNLKAGEVWLKRSSKEIVSSTFKVNTPHLEVDSLGTVFDVFKGDKESVRVLEGKVKIAIKVSETDSSSLRTAETMEIALGQEVSIGQKEISDLQNRRPLYLLALLSDDFRENDWYKWNRQEDASGTGGVSVADAVEKQKEALKSGEDIEQKPAPLNGAQPVEEVKESLTAPVILEPVPANRTIRTGYVVISGTVSAAADKLEMSTYISGKPEPYILKKYKSGSDNWSYSASSQYGNLVAGENKFSVVAISKDGTRSDPVEITVIYNRPAEPADLSAPTVVSFNGEKKSSTQYDAAKSDEVKVEGKTGKGIVKVFVNDFALSKYVQDSGMWVYFAKTAYDNLKPGVNTYSVYGIDFDGNKTPVTTFTITKEKPAEIAAPAEKPATVTPPAAAPASEQPADQPPL